MVVVAEVFASEPVEAVNIINMTLWIIRLCSYAQNFSKQIEQEDSSCSGFEADSMSLKSKHQGLKSSIYFKMKLYMNMNIFWGG